MLFRWPLIDVKQSAGTRDILAVMSIRLITTCIWMRTSLEPFFFLSTMKGTLNIEDNKSEIPWSVTDCRSKIAELVHANLFIAL